jgi:hypothetical protein
MFSVMQLGFREWIIEFIEYVLVTVIPSTIIFSVVAAIGLVLSRIIPAIIGVLLFKTHTHKQTLAVVVIFVRAILFVGTLVVSFAAIGKDVASLLVSLGVVGLGVAIAFRPIAEDWFAGVSLQTMPMYAINSLISINEKYYSVLSIDSTHTFLLDMATCSVVSFPNSSLRGAQVTQVSEYHKKLLIEEKKILSAIEFDNLRLIKSTYTFYQPSTSTSTNDANSNAASKSVNNQFNNTPKSNEKNTGAYYSTVVSAGRTSLGQNDTFIKE